MKTLDQIKGELAEEKKKWEYIREGCIPFKLKKGADFLVFCPGKDPFLSEVKYNNGRQTPNESKVEELAKRLGLGYKQEKVDLSF